MWSALLRTTVLSAVLIPIAYAQISPPDFPPLPVPITSGYTQTDLDQLWQSVEQNGIPVVKANITRVLEPLANFSVGPEPPRFRPAYLQANTSGLRLPEGFLYGVSTAATQVEGAVKEGGRGPSSWDWICHNVPSTCSGETPDVTVNEYYQYKQDIQRVKAMGVNTFSFSIAWPRILPFGSKGSPVSEKGLKFYDDFIDELVKNGIEPVATLFHWDTPINLMSQGGFLNRSIVEDFNNYASIVFQRYGKKVKTWITFNEPLVYCAIYATFPFDATQKGGVNATLSPFICAPNLIEAHATAVQTYRGLVSQGKIAKGKISIKHDGQKPLPFDPDSESDREVADRVADFYLGLFSQPIHVDGNYPQSIEDSFPPSVLRRFTDEEKDIIKGSADFYAIDAYAVTVAKTAPGGLEACISDVNNVYWPVCQDTNPVTQHSRVNGWPIGATADPANTGLSDTTQHMREFLKWLSEKYPSPGGIYITEFGFTEPFEVLLPELYQITWDERRANYLLDYLNEALLAINEDKIDLRGMFIWTPFDNFEWRSATQQKYGLQHVNFSAPGLDRTYKISFFQVRDFFREHLLK
ncbi:hypothetical protein QCA50_009825 [Cerrena zonata]|uniref:Beta-glucosidase n=1 Tax=Cerrena zonata TaxID=2478898 RepID=A0AAW0G7F7_9APHY